MQPALSNTDKANLIMGKVFADLREAWPARIDLSFDEILQSLSFQNDRPNQLLLVHLFKWLQDESYVRNSGLTSSGTVAMATLTEKGLRTLNSIPAGLSDERSYGEKLAEAAKDVGKESSKRAIADLIGQMIGGVVKGIAGS